MRINIEEYNHEWPIVFNQLKQTLWPKLKSFALGIEHVGSELSEVSDANV
jgi:GrpB-like predicted nucleotidyltransferase (UPF0157 family)